MSKSPGKFVDLAQLSMSGSLTPSVPVQILLKYNPPKLTIVYHFESRENDQYYHDIIFDRNMLENETDEDIVSHLYLSEGYYFNPKILKRHQVLRLVNKLKMQMGNFVPSDKSPERHSIHSMSNSPAPMRHQGNIMGSPSYNNSTGGRGRKDRHNANNNQYQGQQNTPFLGGNIDALPNRSPPRNQGLAQGQNSGNNNDGLNNINKLSQEIDQNQMPVLENQNKNFNRGGLQGNTNSGSGQPNQGNGFQQMQQQSAFQRRKNFFERKRFLNYQAHNPADFQNKTDPPQNSNSPPSNSRNSRGSPNQQENFNSSNYQNPLRGSGNNGPQRPVKQQLPPLQGNMPDGTDMQRQGLMNQANQVNQNLMNNRNKNGINDRMPIDGTGPIMNNEMIQNSYYDSGNNLVTPDMKDTKQNNQGNNQSMYNDFNRGNQQNQGTNNSFENDEQNLYNQSNSIQQNQYNNNSQGTLNEDQIDVNNAFDGQSRQTDGEAGQTDEQVSVYMKDNVIMRRIQIEGDEREFLMDPQGQIFDMNGQFIGTANTNELEELADDGNGNNQSNNMNMNMNNGMTDGGWNNQGQNQHEEMMLLDDDDDVMHQQNNYTPGTGDGRHNLGNNNSLDGGTMDMEVMMQNN